MFYELSRVFLYPRAFANFAKIRSGTLWFTRHYIAPAYDITGKEARYRCKRVMLRVYYQKIMKWLYANTQRAYHVINALLCTPLSNVVVYKGHVMLSCLS